jgi:antitoxin component of MazEF toxin-antitoxin module
VVLEDGGANYVARVWRAGKALVVSIPKECAKELGIGEGDIVDVVVRVLKRVRKG